MSDEDTPQMNQRFQSAEGRVMTLHQMGMARWKEMADVKRTEEDFLFNGTLYRPIEESDRSEE